MAGGDVFSPPGGEITETGVNQARVKSVAQCLKELV